MHEKQKSVLLVAMPFAGVTIPSIQLSVLEGYCRQKGLRIETAHLYLKAAEMYGLQHYHSLIYPPNDSYTAQMVFSRYVFPEHWEKNRERFREYFQKNPKNHDVSFDEHISRTDRFYRWILDAVAWQGFDLIGFTLNYGQLLPSLAIAKKIKQLAPEKKIILGGSRTAETLGVHILQAFEYIDFIVSGDGEDALYRLASAYEHHQGIPGLVYRKGTEVVWNNTEAMVDLNTLPVPSYDRFFQELAATSTEVQRYFQYYGRLPVEISRGCWWNRCTFCNLNLQHHGYREKSIGRILQEIQWLSERYRMMDFQLIGNTLPKTEYMILFEKLKNLRRDFSFFVEARAGQLTSEEYFLMKEAGFTNIQTGIESFSKNYLRKMNKGVRVIDNIAVLKFCKENRIKNSYNLLVRYPNEEAVDFEETTRIVQLLKGYLDPPQLCELRVMHGSAIHRHPEQFNVRNVQYTAIDLLMYPAEYLKKGIAFVYDVIPEKPLKDHPWESLVEEWKKQQEIVRREASASHPSDDPGAFYFVDGGNFVKIYDKRETQDVKIFVLNELERQVFLGCLDVVSYKDLQRGFLDVPDFELAAILQSLVKNNIVYTEDDQYLALPLRCRVKNTPEKNIECLVNISP